MAKNKGTDGAPTKMSEHPQREPHYFGEQEELKSAGATSDTYVPYERTYPVDSEAKEVDMDDIPGGRCSYGAPEEDV